MIRATIDKPVTLAMIAAGVLVFGVISFTRLSLDLLPDISYPTLTVRSEFPGSSSREVENLVTRPLEERLGVAGGLKRMLSISRAGEAEIILQFAWDENMDLKIMDIREKLDLYQGPESAKTPRIIRYDPREEPVVRLAIHGLDSTLLFKEGERLKRDLEPLPGIAKVDISGAESEELLVEVDINKLRRHGISLEKVSTTIQEQNVNTASGVLETDGGNYVVRIVTS